jgi:hypothetical protein
VVGVINGDVVEVDVLVVHDLLLTLLKPRVLHMPLVVATKVTSLCYFPVIMAGVGRVSSRVRPISTLDVLLLVENGL